MVAGVSNWMRRYPLPAYFVLATAVTWLLVAPLALAAQGWWNAAPSPHWHALGAAGPLLAALAVTAAVQGRRGVHDLLGRLWRWPGSWGWALVAGLSPVLLFAVAALLVCTAGGGWPAFDRLASAEFAGAGWILGSLASALAYGVGEELGWRGFALPRLQSGRSALAATLLLSLVWAVWHAPMFLYRFEFGPGQVVGFFLGLFAGAVWLSFLYNSTGGSVLAVALWHTVWNVVNLVGLVVSVPVVSLMSAGVMLAAVLVAVVWGPARLSTEEKQTIGVGQ